MQVEVRQGTWDDIYISVRCHSLNLPTSKCSGFEQPVFISTQLSSCWMAFGCSGWAWLRGPADLLQPPCSSNCCSSNTKTTHRRAFALAVPSAWDAPPREQGSLSPFIHISAPMPPHCRDFSDQLLNMPFSLSILFPAWSSFIILTTI